MLTQRHPPPPFLSGVRGEREHLTCVHTWEHGPAPSHSPDSVLAAHIWAVRRQRGLGHGEGPAVLARLQHACAGRQCLQRTRTLPGHCASFLSLGIVTAPPRRILGHQISKVSYRAVLGPSGT